MEHIAHRLMVLAFYAAAGYGFGALVRYIVGG